MRINHLKVASNELAIFHVQLYQKSCFHHQVRLLKHKNDLNNDTLYLWNQSHLMCNYIIQFTIFKSVRLNDHSQYKPDINYYEVFLGQK